MEGEQTGEVAVPRVKRRRVEGSGEVSLNRAKEEDGGKQTEGRDSTVRVSRRIERKQKVQVALRRG